VRILVISASLNSNSKSRALALEFIDCLENSAVEYDFIDMQEFALPFAGSDKCWEDANAKLLTGRIRDAQCIILSAPVYTYDLSAAAKNLVEMTGEGWNEKVVGFLCAAGGARSYMSVMSFANSLMLDYRCLIIPRFVYTVSENWEGMALKNEEIKKRIEELASEALRITEALYRPVAERVTTGHSGAHPGRGQNMPIIPIETAFQAHP
jgi:NAD(P)H-dependent FMN reductase